MHLSISNIAWDSLQDVTVYGYMKKYGYAGLEIAPSRIFPDLPYEHLREAEIWSREMKEVYGFVIPSMQSIWHGRREKLFGSRKERQILADYTKKAIDFAAAAGCRNLVFGCPVNRNLPKGADRQTAAVFFKELGDYAYGKGTVLSIEANPVIYHTNFVNDTRSAIELVHRVGSQGFLLNLDTGTMIQNQEKLEELSGCGPYINHVHISEPGLKIIKKRKLHEELADFLRKENYQSFISIEMAEVRDICAIADTMQYISSVFGEHGGSVF